MSKKLFISGCARSGTSALTKLIGSHEKIVLGMERYGKLENKDTFCLTEEHFTPSRFLTLKKGDTFRKELKLNPIVIDKLEKQGYEYIGDKKPGFFLVYEELFNVFSDATVIFIYRNVYDVAESWNKRAIEGNNWPVQKNYKKAVFSWNNSLITTIDQIKKGRNIICVNYEDIFLKKINLLSLYRKLGLEIDESTKKKLNSLLNKSDDIEKKRTKLNEEEYEFVEKHARFRLLKEIAKYDILKTII